MEARTKSRLVHWRRVLPPLGAAAAAFAVMLGTGCTKVKVIDPDTVVTQRDEPAPAPEPPPPRPDTPSGGNSAVPARGQGISIRASIGSPLAPSTQQPLQTGAGVSFEVTPFVHRK